MKKLLIVSTIVVGITIIASPLVHAHRSRAVPYAGSGIEELAPFAKLRWLRAELDLTDAQAREIRSIVFEVRDSNAAHREAIRASIGLAAGVLIANPDDIDAARRIFEERSAAETQLRENILLGVSKALGVLSPEQRQRLSEIVDEHRARRSEWRR
ncbi:MAG TPA: periplasmic heavy metal sensor [Thermoanaerobaculia bacterium]|nr:periplasmic heavy metal sensor [Thermoanaerobaculia bacterium]